MAENSKIVCQKCHGQGWTEGSKAACCGDVYDSGGACKGECAIEVQTQEQCSECNGEGIKHG